MLSVIISLISGILLSLAFPSANLHWLAWVAIAPLMYFTYRLGWKLALLCAAAFGIGFFGVLLYWIGVFGIVALVALVIFQTLFILAYVAGAKLIGTRLGSWGRFGLLASFWVAIEWLRSIGMFGFTWGDIGYSQHNVLPVLQMASITGVWGVSFLLALSNAALASLALARTEPRNVRAARAQILAVGVAILVVVGFGLVSMNRPVPRSGLPIHAAVVQGNINPDVEMGLAHRDEVWRTYRSMTLSAAADGAELIVWPEAAMPGNTGRDPHIRWKLTELASDANAYLVVGGRDENIAGNMYNSAFLIGPGEGVLSTYSKVRLVPFGEFVPGMMRKHMPFLENYQVTLYDATPGSGFNIMDAGGYKLGTAICFESIFPDISRHLTSLGAEMLCIITNDSWFGWTSAAEQHMTKSVFRAVENRRYLLRSASTGVSCIIDPHGRVLTRSGIYEQDSLSENVWPIRETTFYTRFGDWPVYVSFAMVFILSVLSLRKRTRKHRDKDTA